MRIELDDFWWEEIERTQEFKKGMEVTVAEPVAAIAKSIAPKRTGAYARSLQVDLRGGKIWVTATDYKGHWIEWGTVKWPAHATIRHALRIAGLRLDELPSETRRHATHHRLGILD